MPTISHVLAIASILGTASTRTSSQPEVGSIPCKPDTIGITRSVVDETGVVSKKNLELPTMKCSDSILIPAVNTKEAINYLETIMVSELVEMKVRFKDKKGGYQEPREIAIKPKFLLRLIKKSKRCSGIKTQRVT